MTDYYAASAGTETVCVNVTSLNPAGSIAVADACRSTSDNLYLNKGDTFTENRNVTVGGTSGSESTIGAYGTGVDPKIRQTSANYILRIAADYVILDSLDVAHTSDAGSNPAVFTPTGGWRIGIQINNSSLTALGASSDGFQGNGLDTFSADNTYFEGGNNACYLLGDATYKAKNTSLVDCDCFKGTNNDSYSLHHNGSGDGVGDDHSITRGFFHGSNEDGIDLAGSDNDNTNVSNNFTMDGPYCYQNNQDGIRLGWEHNNVDIYAVTCHDNHEKVVKNGADFQWQKSQNVWLQSGIFYYTNTSVERNEPWRSADNCTQGSGNLGAIYNCLIDGSLVDGTGNDVEAPIEFWGNNGRSQTWRNNIVISPSGRSYIRSWDNTHPLQTETDWDDDWFYGSNASNFALENKTTGIAFSTWQATYGFDADKADQNEDPGLNFTGNRRSRTNPTGSYYSYVNSSSAGALTGIEPVDADWDGTDILGNTYQASGGLIDVGPYNVSPVSTVTATLTGESLTSSLGSLDTAGLGVAVLLTGQGIVISDGTLSPQLDPPWLASGTNPTQWNKQ